MASPQITQPGTSRMDLVAQSFADRLERAAQQAAAGAEQPIGTRGASDAEQLKLWGLADPKVDYDQILQQLQTTGLPPQLLDPNSPTCLEIVKEQPDLAQFYGQPVGDPALAARMAVIAEYPYRMGLLMDIDDPDEQVRTANRLDRAWTKEIGGATAPDGPPPTAQELDTQGAASMSTPLAPPPMMGGD